MYFIWCLMFARMLWILLQTLYSLYVNVCICSISHGFANHAVPLLRYKWLKCRALRKTSQMLLHLLDGIPISDVTLLKRPKTPATGQFVKKLAQGKTRQKNPQSSALHCYLYDTGVRVCRFPVMYINHTHALMSVISSAWYPWDNILSSGRCCYFLVDLGPSLPHGLALIQKWISNYIH